MGKEYLRTPRGTRDIYGEEAGLYEYVFQEFRRIARLHGFTPIYTPTLEYFRLFAEKSGEEIRKTMYVFRDKAGRLLSLRPEVTASVVRAYLRSLRGFPKPLKLYYVANCFRYEEPQRLRYREFWQGGLELIGDNSVAGDLEVAYTASRFLDEIGVKHRYVVGNVAFHRAIMSAHGIPEDLQEKVLHLIDKGSDKDAVSLLSKHSPGAAEILGDFMSRAHSDLRGFIDEYKDVLGGEAGKLMGEAERLLEFTENLRSLGYTADYDPGLVRGLAYYTGLIYEYKAVNTSVKLSIGGGGRYDDLSVIYGGPREYFTGLALGLDRVIAAIVNPRVNVKPAVVIIGLKGVSTLVLLRLKKLFEEHGVSSTIVYSGKVGRGLSYANKIGAGYTVIIGVREEEAGKATVKNMVSGRQVTVSLADVLPLILYEGSMKE